MRLLSVALVLLIARPVWADTYPRPEGFAVTHYDFAVTLGDANNELAVRETASLRFTSDNVRQVALDLCQPRTQAEPADHSNPCLPRQPYGAPKTALAPAAGTGMQVTAVESAQGSALAFTQAHDRLIVTLTPPGRSGDERQITISYHGVPANGLLIGNNRYGDREFFTNEWPDLARNWLAVVDHPSMKATKTMSVTAPRKYQVLSNGLMTEETDLPGDLRRTVWREEVPICTWQFSLAVAPMAVDHFGRFHGIPLSAWVFPQERDAGFKAFSQYTEPILEFYVDHIGPYSYEKLAQVEANGTGGGMELASDIFYGYPPSGPGRQLLAHEMAHQWFGDSITENDWDDVWLSEGFATYFALLYTEHEDGRDAFLRGVDQSAVQARQYALAHPDSTIVHRNLSDISQVIANNAQVYQGGAQVLQMLRGVLGTSTFWEGIRRYYDRYRNRNASSLDFQHAMEEACRQDADCPEYGRDLSWFFAEWLNRGGIMHVTGSWQYDAASHELIVTVDQTPANGTLRQMPFQIGITAAPSSAPSTSSSDGASRRSARPAAPAPLPIIMVKDAHNTIRIPMAEAPELVTLDPNHWVTMAEMTFGKS
jgi:aminopeptidase N